MLKISKKKVCNKSLALISHDIGELHSHGLGFVTIFELLQELDINKNYKASINGMYTKIKEGMTLEDSFNCYKDLYPELFIAFIALGEKYGRVTESMESISNYYNQREYVRNKVKEALTYPTLLITSLVILMIFLVFFMLPNLLKSISVNYESLNFSIRFMILLNNLAREHTMVFLVGLICWGIAIPIIILKYKLSEFKQYFEKKLKISKLLNELTIISILSTLTNSGIPLGTGLDLAIDSMKNGEVKDTLEHINRGVFNGKTIADTMKSTKKFSNYTISLVKIGESSGALDNKLITLELILKKNVEKYIKTFANIIQPAMIFTMTGVILLFMVTCVLPIFATMLGGIG